MKRVVVIAGPTASGKSEIAYRLAKEFGAEIVNADSVQVYKEINIGAAKPEDKWIKEVPHHLYSFVELTENFTAYNFMEKAREVVEDIFKRGKLPLLVGGTGLYIRAFLHGLFPQPPVDKELREKLKKKEKENPGILYRELKKVDPEVAAKLHPSDLVRVTRALEVWYLTGKPMSLLQKEHAFSDTPYDYLGIFLDPPKEMLRKAIERRTEKMIQNGLIDEVRDLLRKGYSEELKPLKSVGYKEVLLFLKGEIVTLEELKRKIVKSTWELARRQRIWFKKEKGFIFVEPDYEKVKGMVKDFYR